MLRLFIAVTSLAAAFSQVLVLNVQNTLINSNTTYSVTVDRSASTLTLPSDGSITFDFPATSYTSTQLTGVTCVPPCTISGTTVRFSSSSFSGTPKNLSISIVGVTNPPSTATPGDYTYGLLDSGNNTLESATTRIVGFTAGQFKGNC